MSSFRFEIRHGRVVGRSQVFLMGYALTFDFHITDGGGAVLKGTYPSRKASEWATVVAERLRWEA